LSAGQLTREAGKYTMKSRRRNLHWGDLNMAELELDKLILHFEQSNKVEGKSPKTITWYTEMITAFTNFLQSTGRKPYVLRITEFFKR
jgi:hypothetical protein